MPKICVVPNCKSNYPSVVKTEGHVTVFRFPRDSALRDQWTRAIPRANWQPTDYSFVCLKHFLPNDISLNEKYKDGDGNWKEIPRKIPALCPGAIPKVFPNCPAYLSKQNFKKRKSPEERKEEEEKRRRSAAENERRAAEEANAVGTFERLVTHVQEKLKNCKKDWSDVPVLRLRLKKPKSKKQVKWGEDTVDNEHLNKKKSKCCCIYNKPRAFGESSDSEDDDECDNCHGHVERRKKPRGEGGGNEEAGTSNPPPLVSA